MASSMRNGAQAATGGQLFKDMIFWVARRKNGGVVTQLENEANLLIADHCKKYDVIPDSISFKFITDSVEKGVTQLPDRYLILPPFGQRTQESKKRTRTTFTPAEDAALLIYVESHTNDRNGNEIYKVFAESNPRHTWHSWRNRYVRILANFSSHEREELRSLGAPASAPASAPVPVPVDPATASAACPRPQRKSRMSASAKENPRQPSASRESTPAQSKEYEAKTEDEKNRDQFEYEFRTFIEGSRRSVSLDPEVEGQSVELYELARAVAAQKVANEQVDWRRVAEDLDYDLKQNQGAANGLKKCFEKNLAAFFEAYGILEAKLYERESSPSQSEEDGAESEADVKDQFYQDLAKFQDRSGLPVKRESEVGGKRLEFWRLGKTVLEHRESNGEVDWQRVAEGLDYDLKQNQGAAHRLKKCFEKNLAALFEAYGILKAKPYERESSPSQSEEVGAESEADDEDQFYQDLESFQDRSGLPVKRESEVGGKRLEFWHLGQAVLTHRGPDGEVDWRRVVGDLEVLYDWRQDQEVVDELKECYKENLAAWFEEEVHDDLEKREAAQEHEEDEFQLNLDSPERQVYPSSPPVGPSGHKRPLDDDDDPVYLPEKSAKRRRLDRTAEIPSTPEEMLGIPSSHTPTSSKFLQQKQDEEELEEDIEELYDYAPPVMSSSDLTPPPGTSHSDFGDVAPSPEPNVQALNVEPIPLNLAPSRSSSKSQQSDHAEPLQQRRPASDANKGSEIKRRSLPSSFYKRPAQKAGKTSQQSSQPESPDRRTSSSEPTLSECVENYEARGYSRDIVMDALHRTSRRPGWQTERLVELLSKNEKVPPSIQGVWIDRDDLGLRWSEYVRALGSRATEAQKTKAKEELEWLVYKHTEKEVELRRRYFEMLAWEKA
ncbi:hypothetical protein E4U40_001516 [Claviceps sp. LM458 group G5]|nr:hypothetical protein E4U40_001516 [Claviceps sp. LM458 group G5]